MQLNFHKTKNNPDKSERRSRTRTLIQLGGLIDKAGLTEMFKIIPGEDLQADFESLDKAASLLGFLMEAQEQTIDIELDFKRWHKTGLRLLKSNVAN